MAQRRVATRCVVSSPDVGRANFPLCLGDRHRRRLLVRGGRLARTNRRFAVILKCAILAAGGAVIAKQLLH
jgi:hypothetical protein